MKVSRVETAEQQQNRQGPVGQPQSQVRPQAPIVARGGVLTPRGTLVVEPSFEFTHTDVNRFTFAGVEIIDTILIGVIEAERADRTILTPAITFRYGITDRIEVDVKIPYVYRQDESTTQTVGPSSLSILRSVDGKGLGDIEFGAHYQINQGRGGWPFFIANVRVKSDTGTGPFDVSRDATGIETELATGSGFWSVEPSVTVLYPTDPAVLFFNIGYLWTIARDVNKTIGGATIGRVDPGDAIRFSFGAGIALNEQVSISLGYQHDVIFRNRTEINGTTTKPPTLNIGQLNVGFNYQVSRSVAVNLNLGVGVTDDAPDLRLLLRVPVAFQLFK